MIDLRVLRDRWTEDGARVVFAELVNQCARAVHPGARAVRPDPGDEGIDTFFGELNGDLHVWQSKYFCEGVGKAQQAQIRESWKACTGSKSIRRVARWTLCIPIEMSVAETKWWQKWRKREAEKWNCQLELWSKSEFVSFCGRAELSEVFAIALDGRHPTHGEAIASMRAKGRPPVQLKNLPTRNHLRDAVFVRKLEAAGISNHRAARTAFYNFELLRAAIEQGGNPDEVAALEDLQVRIFDLWESEFNACESGNLGRPLVRAVDAAIVAENHGRLQTPLPTDIVHKKGGLHYWADLCEAGWTTDFKAVGREDDEEPA